MDFSHKSIFGVQIILRVATGMVKEENGKNDCYLCPSLYVIGLIRINFGITFMASMVF